MPDAHSAVGGKITKTIFYHYDNNGNLYGKRQEIVKPDTGGLSETVITLSDIDSERLEKFTSGSQYIIYLFCIIHVKCCFYLRINRLD